MFHNESSRHNTLDPLKVQIFPLYRVRWSNCSSKYEVGLYQLKWLFSV